MKKAAMRRRSERKKSTDVSSPVPASRRTSRRSRKSPSVSGTENNIEDSPTRFPSIINNCDDNVTPSSDEQVNKPARRTTTRGSRKCSPTSSPVKRRQQHADTIEMNVETIVEVNEEVATNSAVEENVENEEESTCKTTTLQFEENKEICKNEKEKTIDDDEAPLQIVEMGSSELLNTADGNEKRQRMSEKDSISKIICNEGKEFKDILETNIKEINESGTSMEKLGETVNDIVADTKSVSLNKNTLTEIVIKTEEVVNVKFVENEINTSDKELPDFKCSSIENNKHTKKRKLLTRKCFDGKDGNAETKNLITNKNIRKHKWITKSKERTLAISTDSLKNLIADVHLVPLSDVKLQSSSDVDDTGSEREEGENSPTPERVVRRVSIDKIEKGLKRTINETNNIDDNTTKTMSAKANSIINELSHTNLQQIIVKRSPSPAKNQTSCILYITNLVRPFTVLQLKGLLARTGKIVEDGFWMDRIKSKCYVQYETADEAIETRHALHGVRWPVSNPKCLHVEFGRKEDMDQAIQSTKQEQPKFGQENNKDNVIISSGWGRERNEANEKKNIKPIREWDVGKKESSEREKKREKERDRDREDKRQGRDCEPSIAIREDDRTQRSRVKDRSHTHSPGGKIKRKENDPPLRLLDDLFRKTKAVPSIYWLPLTPEQIAEKEAFRLKRIEEHKERVKQRELERQKERERERVRYRNNDRDRERDNRRNRSLDKQRSRSRDRRRY